ncbi:hypothetical protein [Neobacillus sp. LXY-4]|uniref:hypothetical protein n=1 Tax=Neobacillus sp. LXY-4 TaxID=3379826 RepID=UPI003EE204EA
MRARRWFGMWFFSALFLLTGCFNDPVQNDLLNYVNKEMTPAYELENKAVLAYESVTGANFLNDQALYDALQMEVIPNYQKFLKEIKSVKIETDELKEIHKLYISGAETQYKAFTTILEALETQDPKLIEEANDLLNQGKKQINDYLNKLDKLADEHNVELKDK